MELQGVVLHGIQAITAGLEVLGVAVIGVAFFYAALRGLVNLAQRNANAFPHLKVYIGKALQLSLEFLVAADVVRTVTIDLTLKGLLLLGLLILVRTFLSWSITVEIEGCWPWQVREIRKLGSKGQRPEEACG